MTSHQHDNQHQHQHQPGHEPWHDLPQGFADHLDREARLSTPVRAAALDLAAGALGRSPSDILDLGAGTGADALALAERFPGARVHALDVSTELLDRVAATAVAAGAADRIERHLVDLNGDWSAEFAEGADLVWAALSMHHISDPAAALRRVFTSLRPGGVLVLTELTGMDRFTPDDLGTGQAGLAERLAATTDGPVAHTGNDWAGLLLRAGFTAVDEHRHDFVATADTADGREYLGRRLRSLRERLGSDRTGEESAGLDTALAALEQGPSPLSFSSGRAVWVAVRPQVDDSGDRDVDVVVVGGGSAGLAASIALARSRRSVVVIDAGQPRNAPAAGAHNLLGNEGISPLELLDRGRAEAEAYGVRVVPGVVTATSGTIDDFTVEVDGAAQSVRARRLILASGLVDDLPEIPGVREGWGRTVLHCPFCHGWEVRDQRIAILARDEVAVHQALLFSRLSDRVTMFLHEAADPTQEQRDQLAALNVATVRPRVERLVMEGAQVRGVQIEGGRVLDADAAVVVPRFQARTEVYEALGGTAEDFPFGQQIPTDPQGRTPVPGVWAAGNAGQPMAMVVASAASGLATGAAVHGDLAMADLDRAVRAGRAHVG